MNIEHVVVKLHSLSISGFPTKMHEAVLEMYQMMKRGKEIYLRVEPINIILITDAAVNPNAINVYKC